MSRILVLNGPNLNLLGDREPSQYGTQTLAKIIENLESTAKSAGIDLVAFQSNAEHELINKVHESKSTGTDFIIINPAAFTHTSIALRDAMSAVDIPFIEVHLSNIYKRESFRHHSYFSDIAVGLICGLGAKGYDLALSAAINYLKMGTKS